MELLESFQPKENLYIVELMKESLRNYVVGIAPEITEWKGHKFVPGMDANTAKRAYEEWDVPEHSVFVDTFPKTGTNWTLEIVRQILYNHSEEHTKLMKELPAHMFMLEIGPDIKFKLFDHIPLPQFVFGTHLPEQLFNFEKMKSKKGKVIYVIRNPKEQAVSWFHFTRKLPIPPSAKAVFGKDWNEFFNNYVHGILPLNSVPGEWYPDHIRGWMKYKGDKNFLLLVYEDMLKDFSKQIRRIAEFLEVTLSEEIVQSIALSCSFENMKKEASGATDDETKHLNEVGFFRSGKTSSWKNHFSVAQSELMDKIIKEKLADTGISFTYEL